MHPIPLIFRQSFVRSSANLARSTTITTPGRTSATKSITTSATNNIRRLPITFFPPGSRLWRTSRNNIDNNDNINTNGFTSATVSSSASICLRCQFRGRYYSIQGGGKGVDGLEREARDVSSTERNGEARSSSSSAPGGKGGLETGSGNELNVPQEHQQRHGKGRKGKEEEEEEEEEEDGNGNGNNWRLPSQVEKRRSDISKQFTRLMDNIQSNIFIAGQRLNDLTGYSGIEKLKQDILSQVYSSAINRRSASQREVNELLQRKHAWTPTDLERFTSLYRSDHANERAETDAQEALVVAEREAEEAAAVLSKSILSRYHEEQIWSDKIRRMSTWGTWGLMGVNVLLFLIFQVAVEPWRRRRLVKGFEEKVMEALEKENGLKQGPGVESIPASASASASATDAAGAVAAMQIAQSSAVSTPVSTLVSVLDETQPGPSEASLAIEPEVLDSIGLAPSIHTHPTEPLSPSSNPPTTTTPPFSPDITLSPDFWAQTIHDLFSERRITLSQRELTTVALQSAAAGAAMMGVLIAIFRPR
ncbi:hypothetical protein PAAG_11467 [Paracoccidioides lutzii Pb01]|uniref:Sensitive to high expression protein 9, mitochondrial n=1 Tax=Paracoccidioides lutzii (strain ATCC MYA-826 / Pb01) TaxID=502779 RepID=A0A0A2VLM5_PARBA|nr:hypothetical protein PAAG_11467 [Paracoccidioides lutzii Pb01]KGQ01749.1 hypothetical protein PAAG_11467 [Paracoccidioides lutzii Pb01]